MEHKLYFNLRNDSMNTVSGENQRSVISVQKVL
jgi:hypothetical protein